MENQIRLDNFKLQKNISCFSLGDLDIASYYTKAKQLWDESNAIGGLPKCTSAKCECTINVKWQKYAKEQRVI